MASGGARLGAGRPPGVRDRTNKLGTALDSLMRADDALKTLIPKRKFKSMLPMDVLFYAMAHYMEEGDIKNAALTASILMPYTAPKLASMELTATIETRDVDELSDAELATLASQVANSDCIQDEAKAA